MTTSELNSWDDLDCDMNLCWNYVWFNSQILYKKSNSSILKMSIIAQAQSHRKNRIYYWNSWTNKY